nr:hypothetical protein [Tanacetum cinerariifolium]
MMNEDEGIELVKDAEIAESEGRQADKQDVVEVVTTAKLITEVVTAAASQGSAASATIPAAKPSIPDAAPTVVAAYTRRRKGVTIRDPEEELPLKTPAETPKEEIDRDHDGFNKDVDWDATMDHVNQKSSSNPQYIKRYQGMKKRPQTESEARKNMMIYLKNTTGYKMDFFKGMTYAQICPIFQAREDLETLWRIVKDRFSTSKPTNFSDEYLLLTLKTMFEELDGQDAIRRNQKSVHGLALVKRWKLLTSCGVHVITLSTVQLFLLVKR